MLYHDLSDGYFLAATAKVVAWLREEYNIYQINVDDVNN